MSSHETPARRVLIATPTLTGNVDARYVQGLLQADRTLPYRFEVVFLDGDSFIGRARDNLLQTAVDHDVDELVWIDADTVWTREDLRLILEAPCQYIGGLQRLKVPEERIPIQLLPGAVPNSEGILEIARIGFGLTRMTRACFQALYAEAPSYDSGGRVMRNVFQQKPIVDGHFLGEDFGVCDRWRALGGRVYAHTRVRLGHVGAGVLFSLSEAPPGAFDRGAFLPTPSSRQASAQGLVNQEAFER